MADNEILASAGPTFGTFAARFLIPVRAGFIIPVPKIRLGDVAGNQPLRIRAVNSSSRSDQWSFAPKDLGTLDSCDIARARLCHNNEGVRTGNVLHRDGRARVGSRAQSSAEAVRA